MSPLLLPVTEQSRSDVPIPPMYPRGHGEGKPQGVVSTGAVVLALLLAGVATVLFFFDPARSSFYPVCMFHQLTGLQCPGCGGLRALHQLLHGHFIAALHFNLLAVLAIPFLALFCAMLAWRRIRQKPSALIIRPSWLWCGFGLVVAFGVLRNLPVEPFTWLVPH